MSRPDFKDIDRAFDRAAALARCSKMDEAELFEHIKDHLHEAGKFWGREGPAGGAK